LSVSNANGTVGLFVSSTSNVGIGTTNTSDTLTVDGTMLSYGNVSVGAGANGVFGQPAVLFLSTKALSFGNSPTTPQTLMRLQWKEGSGDLGVGEGCSITFAQSLTADTAYYDGCKIASFKETSSDSTRNAALTFWTSTDGGFAAEPAERMRISGTGYVGIGTTNPSSLLHVQGGDIYASSNINGNAGNTTWRLQPQYVGSNPFPSNFRIANGWDPIAGTGQANYAGVGINLNSYQGGSQIEFYTSATNNAVPTERMRISTNGNVGIGTTSPGNMFQVGALVGPIYGNNPLSQSTAIILGPSPSKPTYSGTTTLGGTLFVNATDANASNVGASIALGGRGADFGGGQNHMTFARIQGTQAVTSGAYYGNFVIETQNSGILYERMRINQDGYVGIGIQTPARHFTIVDGGSSPMLIDQTSSSIGDVTILIRKASTTNLTGDNFLNFQTNATYDANGNYVSGAVQRFIVRADGYIASGSLGGGATTLSVDASGGIIRTPSDARLKSNITTITYGLDIANAIRPVFYTWNEPERLGAGRQIGMIAQEVAVLVPEAVSAGLDEDGTLSLDYQKLVPVLTKAIQELSAENTALKSRLDSLEARLAAAGL
jgi:hypothetical protein